MRIVCISDTHNQRPTIPDGDVLIHAGDSTSQGYMTEIDRFNKWLGTLPHKHKIIIAGNHDFGFETDAVEAEACITNAIYLRDASVTIDGVTFYGSPWQPTFHNWAFNLPRGSKLKEVWSRIPMCTEVLITHGPPAGILDRCQDGRIVGCQDLRDRLSQLPKLKLHIFGHIHEAYGTYEMNGVTYINASSCTLVYRATNPPIVYDL